MSVDDEVTPHERPARDSALRALLIESRENFRAQGIVMSATRQDIKTIRDMLVKRSPPPPWFFPTLRIGFWLFIVALVLHIARLVATWR